MVFLLVATPLLLVFSGPVVAQDNILLVTRTQDVITLDGTADEAAWTKAITSDVTVERLSPISVEIRALYDDQNIYMAFKWLDQSKSVIPQLWQYTGGEWASIPHKEDRLSLLWNVDDSIVGFEQNKQGCTATCHNNINFKTGSAQEKGDLWQWMAGRTNPSTLTSNVGWMDDLALKDTGIVPDDFTGGKVWERNSVYAGDGDDATIPFTANDTPKWKEGSTPPNQDPNFLFRGYETDITDPYALDDGTLLPGYLLSRPSTGLDRADIQAKGAYDADKKMWTLEVKRKLVTGHAGDVEFDNLLNTYGFGLAIFDNQGGGKDTHYVSELVTLRFEVPELSVLSAIPSLASPIIGDEINMTVRVKNLGGYSTGFTVAMYADDMDTEPIDTRPYAEMLSGFEEEFNFTWDTTGAAVGKHVLYVKADSADVISEQDRENNVLPVDVWVYPPISSFKSNKKDPEEGTKIKLTANITNPSAEDAQVTVVFYKGTEVLDTQTVNISAGGSTDAFVEWKASKEGKHTFRAELQGAENTGVNLTVNVKAGSPAPGLFLVVVSITLAATVALVSRRGR